MGSSSMRPRPADILAKVLRQWAQSLPTDGSTELESALDCVETLTDSSNVKEWGVSFHNER